MNEFFTRLPRGERAALPAPPASDTRDPKLKELCDSRLLVLDGVEGWAPQGVDRLMVYVRDAETAATLPEHFAGRAVEAVVSREIRAL